MLRFMITSCYCQWIICLVLLGICASVQSIDTLNVLQTGTELSTPLSEQTTKDRTQAPLKVSASPTTEDTFNYADIFKIELHLDIPGNIKILAIDSNVEVKDTISVKLEKHALVENSLFTKEYLEKIKLTNTQKDL